MTTKFKIIIGFFVMILLISAIAATGYVKIMEASDSFTNYQRVALLNVSSSDLGAAMNASIYSVYVFLDERDAKWMDRSDKETAGLRKQLALVRANTHSPEHIKIIETLEAALRDYEAQTAQVRESYLSGRHSYTEIVQPSYRAVQEALAHLQKTAVAAGNTAVLEILADAWDRVALLRSDVSLFSMTRDAREARMLEERLQGMETALNSLESILRTDEGREAYAGLVKVEGKGRAALENMIARYAQVQENIKRMNESATEIRSAAEKLSRMADDRMREYGLLTESINAGAKQGMLGIGAGGAVTGLLFAVCISIGLVRVLNRTSTFADALAKGDFSCRIDVREKGEIGKVIASVREVAAVLNDILDTYKAISCRIARGALSARGEADRFRGDFATLVRGTNDALNAFLTVIDHIPSPVAMLDKELKAEYLNAAAVDLVGADYHGRQCKELFNRDDDGSPSDGLRIAATTNRPAAGETRAHPRGRDMDIAYTAIPMQDAEGKLNAVLQLITDLTAVKETQRSIQKAADQASSVSGRVAAASEELSAQVEQVSRGAEMQRARTESAAAAMTEMNSTVQEVARSASDASEQSERSKNKAEDGAQLVNRVVEAVRQVNRVAEALETNMRELGEQAESIGGVMHVISDIADQTNLLALNAAIEAARAGEAGRGFAVVADEVRKLAEKTMSATQEVGSSIAAVQHSTVANIEEVGTAAKAVAQAAELADSSGRALGEIVELAVAGTAAVSSIAAAAEEQSAVSEEISRAVEEINQVVGETTDGMAQASQAVRELSLMAQELDRIMNELR